MIPEQAITAAKEAMREVTPPPGVDRSDWLKEHGRYALLAGAVAAAAPYIAAKAFDEGKKSGIRHATRLAAAMEIGLPALPGPLSQNPYRPATNGADE